MKLLLLGGNGFLGQQLLLQAQKQNIPCTIVSRSGKVAKNFQVADSTKATWLNSDVLTEDSWAENITPDTVVVDLIGIIKESNNGLKFNDILTITKNILTVLQEKPCQKLIYISAKNGAPKYMQNKRQNEQLIHEANLAMPVKIFRPGLLYQPARSPKEAQLAKLLNLLQLGFLKKIFHSFAPTNTLDFCQHILAAATDK